MKKQRDVVAELRDLLLKELNNDVDEKFDGNKSKAASFLGIHRVPFINLCNAREKASIDKLLIIGSQLEWKIEFDVERKKN